MNSPQWFAARLFVVAWAFLSGPLLAVSWFWSLIVLRSPMVEWVISAIVLVPVLYCMAAVVDLTIDFMFPKKVVSK